MTKGKNTPSNNVNKLFLRVDIWGFVDLSDDKELLAYCKTITQMLISQSNNNNGTFLLLIERRIKGE